MTTHDTTATGFGAGHATPSTEQVSVSIGLFLLVYGIFVILTDAESFDLRPSDSGTVLKFARFGTTAGWCLLALLIYWVRGKRQDMERYLLWSGLSWLVIIPWTGLWIWLLVEAEWLANIGSALFFSFVFLPFLLVPLAGIFSIIVMIFFLPGRRVYYHCFLQAGVLWAPLLCVIFVVLMDPGLSDAAMLGSALSYCAITVFLTMTISGVGTSLVIALLFYFLQFLVDVIGLMAFTNFMSGPLM